MKRRHVLGVVGGGAIVAAGAGGAFLATRTPTSALAPWSAAGSAYTEPRRRALSWAILAPNPHNRQPWQVDLATPDVVTIYADTARLLPHTDPFSRQVTIGLGCFCELLRMAAAADGYRVTLEPFPEGADAQALDRRPVARASFVPDSDVSAEPLFEQVLARRSLKEPFDMTREVPDEALQALADAAGDSVRVGSSNAPARVRQLRELTHTALVVEIETPRTYKESVDLFRIGKREVEANPDGIDFTGPLFETLALTGQFSRELALDRTSAGFEQGRAAVLANTDTAMAHTWLVTAGNTRVDQLRAGAAWLRMNLAATASGVGIHPLSQALQEYPEMRELYEAAHRDLAPDGGTVQMLARLGYGPDVPVSPRWPLEAKLMQG